MHKSPASDQAKALPSRKSKKRAKAMPRTERRNQLLGVAGRIVAEGGIGALTMETLAEAAGVSKPVVYEHWGNSEAVAVALLDAYFNASVEVVDAAARDASTLSEYLSLAVDAQFDFHSEGRLSPWGITNGYSSSERLNEAYRQLQKVTLETFEDLLIQQGVAQDVAEAAGFVLAAMMNNTVYEFGSRADNLAAKLSLKAMLNGALGAIVPAQGTRPRTPERTLATYRRLKQQEDG